MNDGEEKRIIVIGSDKHWGVKTVLWTAAKMPNIADYDNVILDTSSLSALLRKVPEIKPIKGEILTKKTENLLRQIKENQEFIRDRLLHLLHSEGNIYVICSPKEYRRISAYTDCDNYEWSPFPIEIVNELGETKEVMDDSLYHYFQFVKGWSFCFEETERDYSLLQKIHDFYRGKYYVLPKMRVIAENRYTRPIAIALCYELYQFKNETELKEVIASENAFHYYESKRVQTSGKIILLPPPTEIDTREAINILLEDLWGIRQKTPPPEGIDEILLPGEAELKQGIKEREKRIGELEAEASGLETRKEELAQFKQLLYETGGPLEDICKLTFSKLGCKVDDSVEDFILIKGDKEAIVEVKGREGTIERKDGAQLAQNRRNYVVRKARGTREVKAILLGNPWRLLFPLEERTKKESFAAPHLTEDAKTEDTALVTTVELFKAYCAFLESKISSEEIIKRLFSGTGPTKLV